MESNLEFTIFSNFLQNQLKIGKLFGHCFLILGFQLLEVRESNLNDY